MTGLLAAMFRIAFLHLRVRNRAAPHKHSIRDAIDRRRLMAIVDMEGRMPWGGVE